MKNQKARYLKKRRQRSNRLYKERQERNRLNKILKNVAEGYTIIPRSYGFGLYGEKPDSLGRLRTNAKIGGYESYEEALKASHVAAGNIRV